MRKSANHGDLWHKADVSAVRDKLRLRLRAFGSDMRGRLAFLLKQISAIESLNSASARLELNGLVVYALYHHVRHGGLSDKEINRLLDIGFTVLRAQGLTPEKSKVGFLYGELFALKGQIAMQRGEHWIAAWEHEFAGRYSGEYATGGPGFVSLAAANRALRLGQVRIARSHAEEAERDAVEPTIRARARLCRVVIERLQSNLDSAKALAREAGNWSGLDASFVKEFGWETAICEFSANHDLPKLLNKIRRGKEHYAGGYILETILWGLALKERDVLDRLPKVDGLKRQHLISPRHHGHLYNCVAALQQCYNNSESMLVRVTNLGKVLAEAHLIMNIDRELLVWAGAVRWLFRIRHTNLFGLCKGRYENLSHLVSDYQSKDALGVFADMAQSSTDQENKVIIRAS